MNEKLRQARNRRHWSLDEAAKRIGVTRLTVIRWEKGTQIPRGSSLTMACDAFDLPAEQLGFGEEVSGERGVQHFPAQALILPASGSVLGIDTILAFAWQLYRCPFQELQSMVIDTMKKFETMGQPLSRRETLSFLVGLPAAVAGFTLGGSAEVLSVDEVLPLYVTGIPACWKLYYEDGWQRVREVIPAYITQLTPFVESTKYQKTVACLLSQAHQLASLVTLQEENFGTALTHCEQASMYGQLADDPNLQASSLIRRSNIQFYRNRPTLGINRQAMQYIDQVTPLLRSRLYSALGADIAGEGQEQEALRYVGLAQDIFPDAEDDPAFLYTRTTRYIFYLNAAVAHLRLDQPNAAFQMIAQAETYVPEQVSSRRTELLKHLVLASAAAGDLEKSSVYFETMGTTATQLDASFWYTELFTVYQKLQSKWPKEHRVKQLAEVLRQTEVAQ